MTVSYTGTIPAPWIARAVFEYDPMAEGRQLLIADKIARPIQSDLKDGTVPIISRESTMPHSGTLERAPGATYDRGHVKTEGAPFKCVGYGYEHKIPAETQALFSSVMNAEVVAGRTVKGQLLAGRERKIKTLLFDTAVWTGASLYKDWSAAPWDTAGSDAINHVATSKEKLRSNTGFDANALILGHAQLVNLVMTNTAIRGLLSGIKVATWEGVMEFLAGILNLRYIFAGGGVYNAANEAASISVTDIWGDDYAMIAKVAVSDDPSEPCVARIINWRAMGPGTDVEFGVYNEPQSKSRIVQGDLYEDYLVIDTACGFLIKIDA